MAPGDTRQVVHDEAQRLIARYFADQSRRRHLTDGEHLLDEGGANDRLYYVISGTLRGFAGDPGGFDASVLLAGEGDLIGIKSFFHSEQTSSLTVIAEGPCTVSWVRLSDIACAPGENPERVLMPLFVHVMDRRQRMLYELSQQEKQSQLRAAELERSSQLGQFAAGVAHELNNALAVIARGSEWMAGVLDHQMRRLDPLSYRVFALGLEHGRSRTSRLVRAAAKILQAEHALDQPTATAIARMGLPAEEERQLLPDLVARHRALTELWELGATYRDLMTAAEQAGHVIESMKSLGARTALLSATVDLRESIEAAMAIMRNASKGITLRLKAPSEPLLWQGNKGELVQVWTNLIKNACDALRGHAASDPAHEPQIDIVCRDRGESLEVAVSDNGPGIPPSVRPRIFLPHFTTKKSGLHFGLGLGLSIVRKILTACDGDIVVETSAAGTTFRVLLPRQHG